MNAVINSIRGQGRPLENHEIQRLAPSVFAETAAPGRSHRYTFIPTIDAVEALRNEGFLPVYAGEARSRKARSSVTPATLSGSVAMTGSARSWLRRSCC